MIESIRQYGIDVYYMARTLVAKDSIFNEDDLSKFETAYEIEMYIKNVDGFQGEGDFLSKFGLEIRDEMTLTVARRVFVDDVGQHVSTVRPKEGDLIYFPLNQKVFEIKFVEHENIFYQMGGLQVYDLTVELFEFSNEIFSTGIDVIDNLYASIDTTSNNSIEFLEGVDTMADNSTFQTEAVPIIDFTEENPFGEPGQS